MRIGIIGEGRELLNLLKQREFPIDSVQYFAPEDLQHGRMFQGLELVFACASNEVSQEYAADITRYGTIMIDCSAAFHKDIGVPKVVPEANPEDAFRCVKGIIACPSERDILLAITTKAIENISPIRRVQDNGTIVSVETEDEISVRLANSVFAAADGCGYGSSVKCIVDNVHKDEFNPKVLRFAVSPAISNIITLNAVQIAETLLKGR